MFNFVSLFFFLFFFRQVKWISICFIILSKLFNYFFLFLIFSAKQNLEKIQKIFTTELFQINVLAQRALQLSPTVRDVSLLSLKHPTVKKIIIKEQKRANPFVLLSKDIVLFQFYFILFS